MKKYAILLGMLFSFFFPSTSSGDVVKMKEGGASFEGIIIYKTKDEIWLDIGKGKLIFKRTEVNFVIKPLSLKKRKLRISIVSVPDAAPEDNKGDQGSSSKGTIPDKGTAKKKKEKVSDEDLGQIKRWLMELSRSRSKYRLRAIFRVKGYATQYPVTVLELILGKLRERPDNQAMINYCQILEGIRSLDNTEMIEELMKSLRHTSKQVRHHVHLALQGMTGESISYPEPTEGLDNSISTIEERAIGKWRTWWNTFQTKRIQEELKKEKASSAGKADQDASELLNKLKKLLKK